MDRSNYLFRVTDEDRALIKLFSEELNRINALYLKAIKSNDISKANQLLRKMGAIINTLDENYEGRADKRLRQEYLLGAKYIDDTLTLEKSYILINKATRKELVKMVEELGEIHVDAVNALLNNSKMYVKSSLDGMERQALTMLNELQQEQVRENLARGVISGESLGDMKARVKKYFTDNSIT